MAAVAGAEPLQRELAARHGLSLADFRAVRLLARLGETQLGHLGVELGIPRSTITNLVDRLERAGLAERCPSADDRRVALVRPTTRGEAVAKDVGFMRESPVIGRLLALAPAEQEILAGLLERVGASAEGRDAGAMSPAGAEPAGVISPAGDEPAGDQKESR